VKRGVVLALAVLAVVSAGVQDRAAEPYRPEHRVTASLRVWGHGSPATDFMGELVRSWQQGFRRYQPGVEFDNRMYGTASAIGALYADQGDVAILGREIRPFEVSAFERVKGHPPLGIDIATGSLDVRNSDFALVVFVNRENPISRLTIPELEAIFGCERRSAAGIIRTWAGVGLRGEWAGRAIHTYGSRISGGFAVFFQDVVLHGSGRWNPGMREFFDLRRADGSLLDSGQQVVDAVGNDRDGIGVSSLHYANPRAKPLALAMGKSSDAHAATRDTLVARSYPLTRIIPAFIDRSPDAPVKPAIREFLRYILSREGQEDIVRDGRYLPLSGAAVREQLRKLQ
jgi:phosphate transport system substrate-binding protein